ncbi:hypothetical protein [Borrelia sp. P9F1]|uniref:hypothetical protein n=1 Tax=Borrelia sp. P9F1 TaxID=3058374 RepID=UPI002648CA45|nr:hypothetical protein [Borrelia sp. P9F1]WKC58711.1 hypothetical protein QYZ68_05770 [Borrelia sp. P9F1]
MGRYVLVFLVLVTILMSCGQDSSKSNTRQSEGHKISGQVKEEGDEKTEEDQVSEENDSVDLEDGSKKAEGEVNQKGRSKEKKVKYKIKLKEGSQIKMVYDDLLSNLELQRTEFKKAKVAFAKLKAQEQSQLFVDPFIRHIPNVSKEKQERILDKIYSALGYDVSTIRRVGETFNQLINCEPAISSGLIVRLEHLSEWNHEYLISLLTEEILYRISKDKLERVESINQSFKNFVQIKSNFIQAIEELGRKGIGRRGNNKLSQEGLCKVIGSDNTTKIRDLYDRLSRIRRGFTVLVNFFKSSNFQR